MVYSKDLLREQQILQEISDFEQHYKILSSCLKLNEKENDRLRLNPYQSHVANLPCSSLSVFSHIIESGLYYIDKTSYISSILSNTSSRVRLFTRPRRFGKSLFISMLKSFFELHPNTPNSYKLFKNLDISRDHNIIAEHQGKYPILYLNFSGFPEIIDNFESFRKHFSLKISQLFRTHSYVVSELGVIEKGIYSRYLGDNFLFESMFQVIPFLCESICIYHSRYGYGKKSIILIDEYDAPFNKIVGKSFEKEAFDYLKVFYESITKEMDYIFHCVFAGVYEVSIQTLLSSANNYQINGVYSNPLFSCAFGYSEREIDCLLQDYNLSSKKDQIKDFYDGYRFGYYGEDSLPEFSNIYNPFSVNHYIYERVFHSFWVNSGGIFVLEHFIEYNFLYDITIMNQLYEEIKASVFVPVNRILKIDPSDKFSFGLFGLLFHCGYLTVKAHETIKDNLVELVLVNKEVRDIFPSIYRQVFGFDFVGLSNKLTGVLEGGNIEGFIKDLNDFMESVFTYQEQKLSEFSYQLMLITFFQFCKRSFEAKQNVISGKGKLDVSLLPYSATHPLYIFELKQIISSSKPVKRLQELSILAHSQIVDKEYINTYEEYINRKNIQTIYFVGISFWFNKAYCTYSTHNSKNTIHIFDTPKEQV